MIFYFDIHCNCMVCNHLRFNNSNKWFILTKKKVSGFFRSRLRELANATYSRHNFYKLTSAIAAPIPAWHDPCRW